MKRPSREERRKRAKREIGRGDPRKSHEDCPIQAAIDARRAPEVELSPFPEDDLVETPAPRSKDGFAASPDSDGVRRVALGNEERLPDKFKSSVH